MASCRCADKEKMRNDLGTLYTIVDKIDILAAKDSTVETDLTHLNNVCEASFITKDIFSTKLSTLKGSATSDIKSLKDKVNDLIEQVNNEYDAAKSEDDTYHREQLLKFFGIG